MIPLKQFMHMIANTTRKQHTIHLHYNRQRVCVCCFHMNLECSNTRAMDLVL